MVSASAGGLTASKQVRIGPAPVPIRVVLTSLTPADTVPLFMKVAIYAGAEKWQRMFSAPLPVRNVYINEPGLFVGNFASSEGVVINVGYQIVASGSGGGNAGQGIVFGTPITNGRVSGPVPATPSNRWVSLAGLVNLRSQATNVYTPTNSGVQNGRSPEGWINLVVHEMGHALGLFGSYGYGSDPERIANSATDPRWIGSEAVRQYGLAGGRLSGGVPMSQDGHWKACEVGGDVMTGGLALSAVTLGALADLGYTVNLARADPYVVRTSPC